MNIACLLFHEVHELNVIGPYSVLIAASRRLGDEPIEPGAEDADVPAEGVPTEEARQPKLNVFTIAKSRNSVETSGGLVITPHRTFASAPTPEVIIVPGGRGIEVAIRDKPLRGYLERHTPQVRLLASVSTGALLLGEMGLLKDLRATTWAGQLNRLKDYEPGEIVDERVVKNPNGVWCSGGVSAGIDLGLELVADFFDPELARDIAIELNYPFWAPQD